MSSKEKLCIVLPYHWSHSMGGSEYQIKCLIESPQLQNYFLIHVLSANVDPDFKPVGYHLHRIARLRIFKRFTDLLDTPFLLKKLKQISPSVIYLNVGTSYAGICAYYARKTTCKLVFHIASDANLVPNHKKTKSLIKAIEQSFLEYGICGSHRLIAQTFFQEKLINNNFNRNADGVIYNFHPYPKEKSLKNHPIKVLWIANFKPLKQPELFIRLADDISKTSLDAEFLMIGRPSNSRKWQRLLEQRILDTPRLSYLGEKSVDEVNHILSQSHIIVNTSRYEGFSNTFIQAWLRSVPVVSLNSNPDGLLTGKKLGFWSESYSQLRYDVARLIINDDFREKLGREARIFALNNFSTQNIFQVLEILKN